MRSSLSQLYRHFQTGVPRHGRPTSRNSTVSSILLMESACGYLQAGLTSGTRRVYDSAARSFYNFCHSLNLPTTLPVSELTLILYAAFKARSTSAATVRLHIAAIRSWHIDAGARLNTETMLSLKRVLEGIKRVKPAKPKRTRLPVTVELLNRIANSLDMNIHNNRLFMAICAAATYGLLRLGEVVATTASTPSPMLRSHLKVTNTHSFSIFLPKSKTDQHGEGFFATYVANGKPSCPFNCIVAQYINRAPIQIKSNGPLFLLANGLAPTKRWVIAQLQAATAKLGLQHASFTGHSFRRGGATSLAEAGVPDHLIKHLGRWRSAAFQLYIDPHPSAIIRAASDMSNAGLVFGGSDKRSAE
jgi:hypothetical protein